MPKLSNLTPHEEELSTLGMPLLSPLLLTPHLPTPLCCQQGQKHRTDITEAAATATIQKEVMTNAIKCRYHID